MTFSLDKWVSTVDTYLIMSEQLTKRPEHLPPASSALWDWIEKQTLTQRQAAKALRIPFPTFNHYLHNRRRPGLERLKAIFEKTGIPIALWLDTRVSRAKKRRTVAVVDRQYLQAGNANAR